MIFTMVRKFDHVFVCSTGGWRCPVRRRLVTQTGELLRVMVRLDECVEPIDHAVICLVDGELELNSPAEARVFERGIDLMRPGRELDLCFDTFAEPIPFTNGLLPMVWVPEGFPHSYRIVVSVHVRLL